MWININHTWYTSAIYILTEFYIGFSNIQFVGILYAIRKYFKTVNEHLRKCTFGVSTLRDCRTFLFIIESSQKQDGLFDIIKFRELHLNLSCICLKLNQCYTVQILLFLVLCMIEITYSLRSGMIFVVSSNDKSTPYEWAQKPWKEIILTVLWGGYYFINLLELVSSCDFTAAEVSIPPFKPSLSS
ncbi:UNVERIFIED_CONTAM: hypothetical protein PYX00_004639 [Menopon gallinae]|uniref:Uncharacterized protein n=1 Tax=Menopon gallinae TaxID=328185 RepID=A0AAW2I566_9NEOP